MIPIDVHYSSSPGLFYLDLANGKRSAYFSKDQAVRILTTVNAQTRDGGGYQPVLDALMKGKDFDTLYIDDEDRGLAMSLMSGTVVGPKKPKEEMEKYEALIDEAEGGDPMREPVAGKLIDQFKGLGIELPPDQSNQYQSIFSGISKLVSLLSSTQASSVHKGSLAPLLIELAKFDYFPISEPDLTTAMKASEYFSKSKGTPGFPFSMINYYVGSGVLARQGKGETKELVPGTVNMRDLIDYLKYVKLGSGRVVVP